MLRTRTRISGRAWQTTKVFISAYNTEDVSSPSCRGEQATATAVTDWKAEKLNGRVEFGRS
nr:MAG TPA: hypothetical protein [Caudoviricetes sp.]